LIAGVDEVGRGCLAGPVVVAGVIFSSQMRAALPSKELEEIRDSKQIRAEKREELSEWIKKNAMAFQIESVSEVEIDAINILQATFKAARKVVDGLSNTLKQEIDFILMDGNQNIPGLKMKQLAVIGGDRFSKSIAAASIVAKVERDRRMVELSKIYPGYQFEANKGYGVESHQEGLMKLGPCKIHRRSFLKKMQSLKFGADAELRVVEFLQQNDFRIMHKNWQTKGGEIDIVAGKGKEIHFIEVRARHWDLNLELSFPPEKQGRFQRAVQLFRAQNSAAAQKTFHLHLISVNHETITPLWDVFQL